MKHQSKVQTNMATCAETAAQLNQRMKKFGQRAELFLENNGFEIAQENGQRISTLKSDPKPKDEETEIFLGKIPRDMFEDELLPFLSKAGRVQSMRLMMDFSLSNRGFGFVRYMTTQEAAQACRQLDGLSVRPNTTPVGLAPSLDNRRLYFGNLPGSVNKSCLLTELKRVVADVVDVELLPTLPSGVRNARVIFKSHKAATQARRILLPGNIKMFGRQPTIDWAKPAGPKKLTQMLSSPKVDENNNVLISNVCDVPSNPTTSTSSLLSLSQQQQQQALMQQQTISWTPFGQPSLSTNALKDRMSNFNVIDAQSANQQQPLSPNDILGVEAQRMCNSEQLKYRYDKDCVITVANIHPKFNNLNQLKRIFQLVDKLRIVDIFTAGIGAINIAYETKDMADLMLEALVINTKCFAKLAVPNMNLMAYRPLYLIPQ